RRTTGGETTDINPAEFNARTRVHEYGGGDYLAHAGVVYFSNFSDQQLYRQTGNSTPEKLTQETTDRLRYGDSVADSTRNRLIAVREDHRQTGRQAQNTIAAISLDGGAEVVLVSGNDFYSSPHVSPDASQLAWLTWKHPNMPWDGCELWTGDFDADGSITNQKLIAGGHRESIFQPEWSPDGTLYFISDRSGWWNLYRLRDGVEPVSPLGADFGRPLWQLGTTTWAFADEHRLVVTFVQDAR